TSALLRAEALQALGRPRDALEVLARADFARAKERPGEVLQAAELYRSLGALDRARALLRSLLATHPAEPDAVRIAVRIELAATQPAQARAILDRALSAAPNSAQLL